jgi:biopolymer transport protein ExbD
VTVARFARPQVNLVVPTASMADIAFLLLIFFMATTIFKLEEGLPVTLPQAEGGEQTPRTGVARVWVSTREITIDDMLIGIGDIAPLVAAKVRHTPGLVVAVTMDQDVPWETAAQVIDALKEAGAQAAAFSTEDEPR